MKIGVFSKTYNGSSLETVFPYIYKDEIESIQFNFSCVGLDPMSLNVDESILDKINTYKDKYNIRIDALTGTFNMIDPDLEAKNKAIEQFKYQCYLASRIGAPIITLCTGSKNIDKWVWDDRNNLESSYLELLDTTRKIIKYAEEYGIILAVETEQANVINTPLKARKYLDDINSPNLKIVLDCANLFNLDNINNVDGTIKQAFELLGKDIVSAHAKDVNKELKFVCTGDGIVNYELFISLLRKYNYDGSILMHGLKQEEIIKGRDYLRRIINGNI